MLSFLFVRLKQYLVNEVYPMSYSFDIYFLFWFFLFPKGFSCCFFVVGGFSWSFKIHISIQQNIIPNNLCYL